MRHLCRKQAAKKSFSEAQSEIAVFFLQSLRILGDERFRCGIKAADFPDQIPQEIKERRNQILLDDLAVRTKKHMDACVGRTFRMLAEGVSRRNAERWSGKTTCCRTVNFLLIPELKPGDFVEVKITRAGAVSLFGECLPR